jgi:hypothetical protein
MGLPEGSTPLKAARCVPRNVSSHMTPSSSAVIRSIVQTASGMIRFCTATMAQCPSELAGA